MALAHHSLTGGPLLPDSMYNAPKTRFFFSLSRVPRPPCACRMSGMRDVLRSEVFIAFPSSFFFLFSSILNISESGLRLSSECVVTHARDVKSAFSAPSFVFLSKAFSLLPRVCRTGGRREVCHASLLSLHYVTLRVDHDLLL